MSVRYPYSDLAPPRDKEDGQSVEKSEKHTPPSGAYRAQSTR